MNQEELQTNPESTMHREDLRRERRIDLLYGYGILFSGAIILFGSIVLLLLPSSTPAFFNAKKLPCQFPIEKISANWQ